MNILSLCISHLNPYNYNNKTDYEKYNQYYNNYDNVEFTADKIKI